MTEKCPGWGFEGSAIEGPRDPYDVSSASCWKAYCDRMALEFSGTEHFAAHRLTVDAYMVQHSSSKPRASVQSTWVHLVGLYLTIEVKAKSNFVGRILGEMTRIKRDYKPF